MAQRRQRASAQPSQALATTGPELKTYLQRPELKASIARIAPRALHLDPDRFTALALKMVNSDSTGKLAQCTRASLTTALLHCAELGLEPGGPRAKAYVIPYWNDDRKAYEAQFQIGVWGLSLLAQRSGRVAEIWSDVIYSEDSFRIRSGSAGRVIEHEPRWDLPSSERGTFRGAYACCRLTDGTVLVEVVNAHDVAKARSMNRGKSPAWDQWHDEMARKVALKRGAKYWPEPDDGSLSTAIGLDDSPGTTTLAAGRALTESSTAPTAAPRAGALDRVIASRQPPVEIVTEPPEPEPQTVREPEPPTPSEPVEGAPARAINPDDRHALHDALSDWSSYWGPAAMRSTIDTWSAEERRTVAAWLDAGAMGEPPDWVLPPREPGSDG